MRFVGAPTPTAQPAARYIKIFIRNQCILHIIGYDQSRFEEVSMGQGFGPKCLGNTIARHFLTGLPGFFSCHMSCHVIVGSWEVKKMSTSDLTGHVYEGILIGDISCQCDRFACQGVTCGVILGT